MTEIDIEMSCPMNNLSQEMSLADESFRLRIEAIYQDWRNAIVFIATLEGCLGLAKNAKSLPLLYSCGQGLMELRNVHKITSPSDSSFCPASALQSVLRSWLCATLRALNRNKNSSPTAEVISCTLLIDFIEPSNTIKEDNTHG